MPQTPRRRQADSIQSYTPNNFSQAPSRMGHSQYSGVINGAPYNGGMQSGGVNSGAPMYNGVPYNGAVTYTAAPQQIGATSYQPPSYAPGPAYAPVPSYNIGQQQQQFQQPGAPVYNGVPYIGEVTYTHAPQPQYMTGPTYPPPAPQPSALATLTKLFTTPVVNSGGNGPISYGLPPDPATQGPRMPYVQPPQQYGGPVNYHRESSTFARIKI